MVSTKAQGKLTPRVSENFDCFASTVYEVSEHFQVTLCDAVDEAGSTGQFTVDLSYINVH